jgi:hypothetical protein
MTLVQWVKKNSRAFGKVALYGTGAVLIGLPLVTTGNALYRGETMMSALDKGVYDASGYSMNGHHIDQTKVREVVFRDVVGALAIYAARKI